jgi:hypothetical protein
VSNAANMCVACLRTQVDITAGMPKQCILHQCRGCLRFLRPPWVACELESKELLAICLKKITGLTKVGSCFYCSETGAVSHYGHGAQRAATFYPRMLPPLPARRCGWWTRASSGRSRTRGG